MIAVAWPTDGGTSAYTGTLSTAIAYPLAR
jgi:hypothetical protein